MGTGNQEAGGGNAEQRAPSYEDRLEAERDERHARITSIADAAKEVGAEAAQHQRDRAGGAGSAGQRVETAMRGVTLFRMMQWQKRNQAQDFAAALGVSERCAREYLVQLRRAGYNIRCEPGVNGYYWLAPGEQPPPMTFTWEELEMIIIGLLAFTGAADRDDPRIPKARTVARLVATALPYHRQTEVFEEGKRISGNVFRWWMTAKGFGKGRATLEL